MNKSLIVKFFHGFEGTAETIKMSEREHELMARVANANKELVEKLTPEQTELYKKFIEAREDSFYARVLSIISAPKKSSNLRLSRGVRF